MYRALLGRRSPSNGGDGEGRPSPPAASGTGNSGVSVEAVKKNRALSKLLVLAKRERVKQDLRKRQGQLTEDILAALRGTGDGSVDSSAPPLTVGELMERLGKPGTDADGWPTPTDVHVHLHHLVMGNGHGSEQILRDDHRVVTIERKVGRDGLLLPCTELSIGSIVK